MTPDIYIPLLAALAGALIGTMGTIIAVLVQASNDNRKHKREMTLNMASELRKTAIEVSSRVKGRVSIPPIEVYIAHTARVLDAVDKGKLTPATLAEAEREMDDLIAFIERREERRSTAEE